MNKIVISSVCGLLLSLSSCSGGKTASSTNTEETHKMEAAAFDADSAYHYVSTQVSFGVRTPGSKAHESCGNWIIEKLRGWGYNITQQNFSGKDYFGKDVQGLNIIASQAGAGEHILLMAHWDTRQVGDHDPNPAQQSKAILGADDGGSGVAVLLELARQNALRQNPLPLDFVFFDLEDGGRSSDDKSWCLGSQYWAKNPHTMGYQAKYGILLDMVGAKDAKFYWEGYSKSYAAPLQAKIWQVATALGWSNYFVRGDGGTLVDDHVPVIEHRQIPCVDIVNYSPERASGFGDHWHTQRDNMNIISVETLRAVGQTVATLISKE